MVVVFNSDGRRPVWLTAHLHLKSDPRPAFCPACIADLAVALAGVRVADEQARALEAGAAVGVGPAGRLGIDTEFVPEGRYRPLLCLVQVCVEAGTAGAARGLAQAVSPKSSRPISMRRISEVPAPIS